MTPNIQCEPAIRKNAPERSDLMNKIRRLTGHEIMCVDTNRIDIMKQVSFINMVIKKKERENKKSETKYLGSRLYHWCNSKQVSKENWLWSRYPHHPHRLKNLKGHGSPGERLPSHSLVRKMCHERGFKAILKSYWGNNKGAEQNTASCAMFW